LSAKPDQKTNYLPSSALSKTNSIDSNKNETEEPDSSEAEKLEDPDLTETAEPTSAKIDTTDSKQKNFSQSAAYTRYGYGHAFSKIESGSSKPTVSAKPGLGGSALSQKEFVGSAITGTESDSTGSALPESTGSALPESTGSAFPESTGSARPEPDQERESSGSALPKPESTDGNEVDLDNSEIPDPDQTGSASIKFGSSASQGSAPLGSAGLKSGIAGSSALRQLYPQSGLTRAESGSGYGEERKLFSGSIGGTKLPEEDEIENAISELVNIF
jgi:hypothetical protein